MIKSENERVIWFNPLLCHFFFLELKNSSLGYLWDEKNEKKNIFLIFPKKSFFKFRLINLNWPHWDQFHRCQMKDMSLHYNLYKWVNVERIFCFRNNCGKQPIFISRPKARFSNRGLNFVILILCNVCLNYTIQLLQCFIWRFQPHNWFSDLDLQTGTDVSFILHARKGINKKKTQQIFMTMLHL